MFTFQSVMFVSLGFLCALLLGFVVAPAFWARAVRLTTNRLRASLPLSEQEIRAERDRLRAENAIRVHQLTAKIERARLYDARQKVEINRRDGTISALQRTLQQLETEREGSENARRVLEATITQRVPEIESRLVEARQLLAQRDAEMKALQNDTGRTFRALDDAMQVNAKQRAEIDRLKSTLAGGLGPRLEKAVDSDSEITLKAELENLRAISREQSALIIKLQSATNDSDPVDGGKRRDVQEDDAVQQDTVASVVPLSPVAANNAEGKDATISEKNDDSASQQDFDALKAKFDSQALKIESLSSQLAIYENEAGSGSRSSLSLRDTKSTLQARIAASVKEIAARDEVIEGLRREIAAANERTARQASYYQDELRRLGAGGGQLTPDKRPAVSSNALAADAQGESNGKSVEMGRGADYLGDQDMRDSLDPDVVHSAKRSSLEERLATVEADTLEKEPDLAGDEAAPDIKSHRGKLMDRIAGLAKR